MAAGEVEITPEQMVKIKETFKLFDRDGDDMITTKELGTVMRALGQNPTESELQDMLNEVDPNGHGQLEMREFIGLMRKRLGKSRDTAAELLEAFKIFDKDGNGTLPSTELRHIMLQLGEKLSEAELDAMMKEADKNNDGFVNYAEFIQLMLSR
mmetsp:Transcript_27612/g.70337  ORF Transcript_27612/g.70337 Transcript_27612/m.70337 type:complete len:154 (-) Transcript_27612:793-1254(-)|eukprot:CAMPEP_0202868852 /NCGR_PEP_ID=MMETSP1391-20130828/11228_1 /ASSEMBLY_ACC=CAM_ASM_000867 /TAXON_ID=1034604 /ORGANISM="Chlamydomonas leiostraca, Strain SAG 11-49" /LENGTH=153 /DNA_ID=CAMNT_0049549067 /DNA_START=87 /DNA_END=548 /DNA_ORIENTATION=-